MTSYSRSAFGVQIRPTLIYERALELAHKLCWNSEDLGISRVHVHRGKSFKSVAALQRYCEENGESVPPLNYYFDWMEPIKELSGGDRARDLREHWCNREQVVNILFDTAMQAYLDDGRNLLSSLTGGDFGSAELVKFDIKNQARQYTGAPDSTFVDLKSKSVVLVEIKIGNSSTKYSLDQSVKYETMAALLRSDEFFPGFRVHKVLIAPLQTFSLNTKDVSLLGQSSDSEGKITFAYDATALAKLKPLHNRDIHELVSARLQILSKGRIDLTEIHSVASDGISFFSWGETEQRCSPGLLRDNLHALMKHLAPIPYQQSESGSLGG